MDGFVYGQRRPLPQGFDEFLAVADTAIVSIDLHQGHLADTPDCPCPAPRAREIVESVNRFHAAAREFRRSGDSREKRNPPRWE